MPQAADVDPRRHASAHHVRSIVRIRSGGPVPAPPLPPLRCRGGPPMTVYSARLAALRTTLANRQLDGFVVPLTDEHLSEYVGDYAQRLAWLTGFQGSAGTAVVLADRAAIFTDG